MKAFISLSLCALFLSGCGLLGSIRGSDHIKTVSPSSTSSDPSNNDNPSPTPSPSPTAIPGPPPIIESVSPPAGATEVELAAAVEIRFADDMDPATINASNITMSDGSDLPGTVTYNSDTKTVTFVPSQSLPIACLLTATVRSAVSSLDGRLLGSDFSWTFTTIDGNWSSPQRFNSGYGSLSDLAMNSKGDAMLTFEAGDPHDPTLAGLGYTESGGWQAPITIGSGEGPGGRWLALSDSGDAIYAWRVLTYDASWSPIGWDTWAKMYRFPTGWGTTRHLGSANLADVPQDLKIAIDTVGRPLIVWAQPRGQSSEVYEARYTRETDQFSVTAPTNLTSTPVSLSTIDDGNAVLLSASSSGAVITNQYVPGQSWLQPVMLSSNGLGTLALSPDGRGIALSTAADGTGTKVRAHHFEPNLGWQDPVSIDHTTGVASELCVATSTSGWGIAAWVKASSALYAATYDKVSWSQDQPVATPGNAISGVKCVIDRQGRAFVGWYSGNLFRISRFVRGTKWPTADPIGITAGVTYVGNFGMGEDGRAVTVWTETIQKDAAIYTSDFK